jgi:hypothetical protein
LTVPFLQTANLRSSSRSRGRGLHNTCKPPVRTRMSPPPLSPPFPAEELEAHGSPHCKLANASYKHPSPFKNSASRKTLISLSTFPIGFGQHSIRIIQSLRRSTTVLGHPSIILQKTRCLASGLAACCSHSQRSGKDVSVFQLSVPFSSPPFP